MNATLWTIKFHVPAERDTELMMSMKKTALMWMNAWIVMEGRLAGVYT